MLFAQIDMKAVAAAEEFAGAPLISPFGIVVIVVIVFMFRKQIGAYLNSLGQPKPAIATGTKPTTDEVFATLVAAGVPETEADKIVQDNWVSLRSKK